MKISLFLLIILLIFAGFIMRNTSPDYPPSKGEQLINSLLAKSAKVIKDKYNLRPSGVGVAMPGGPIQKVALCFDTKYTYTKEQLRAVLIKVAQELLDKVNQTIEIQEFLHEKPFTIKNIQIIIYNHDKNNEETYDPDIATAEILQGILTYQTVDASDTFRYKQKFTETYEEALKIIQAN